MVITKSENVKVMCKKDYVKRGNMVITKGNVYDAMVYTYDDSVLLYITLRSNSGSEFHGTCVFLISSTNENYLLRYKNENYNLYFYTVKELRKKKLEILEGLSC